MKIDVELNEDEVELSKYLREITASHYNLSDEANKVKKSKDEDDIENMSIEEILDLLKRVRERTEGWELDDNGELTWVGEGPEPEFEEE